jgi:mannose-6-phosphate isomerase-like protein (cupin superfamily)
MSSTIRELAPCHVAPGSIMRIYEDLSKGPSDMERRWTETTWDGESAELFSVPKHWHAHHDEHTEILEGKLNIFIGDRWHVVTPETGKVVVPRGVVHGFRGERGCRMRLKESVFPGGGYKIAWVLFRLLFP